MKYLHLFVITFVLVSCADLRTMSSISQVDPSDEYLYMMDYKSDYDLDEVIAADIDSNDKLLDYVVRKIGRGVIKPKSAGCTSFQVESTEGGYLFGRNYDFFKNPTMVVTSHPKKGYSSISTCDMAHFGYGMEKLPDSMKNKLLSLATIYGPMDGMNEKGLCVSIMALPKQAAYQNSGKHKVGTSIIMRLWLDRCATVQEALDLLATVDVCHDQKVGGGYHYLVADASGDCAAVEFDLEDGWKTLITRKPDGVRYMHMTNHILYPKYFTSEPDPKYGNPHSKSWWRYATVKDYIEARCGVLTADQAAECLSNVRWVDLVWDNGMVENTQWSGVYDQSALTLTIRNWNSYDAPHVFSLKQD